MSPPVFEHTLRLRVRYSETDQMGTFYNSRALEWFEVARTELLRAAGIPYAEMETRDILLPLVEAHVEYRGRARYDDLLEIRTRVAMLSKVRMRFDVEIVKLIEPRPTAVAGGYTIHAILDAAGKPTRAPDWLLSALANPSVVTP